MRYVGRPVWASPEGWVLVPVVAEQLRNPATTPSSSSLPAFSGNHRLVPGQAGEALDPAPGLTTAATCSPRPPQC